MNFKVTRPTFAFRYQSAQHWVDIFRTFYGSVHKIFGTLDEERQRAFADDLIALPERFDTGAGAGLVVPIEYLEVVLGRAKAGKTPYSGTAQRAVA